MIIDLDQTITLQSTTTIPSDYAKQLNLFKTELGKENICFLSNEISNERATEIEKQTDIKVIKSDYKKPDHKAYQKALEYLKAPASKRVAMIGDRMWTDILGANRLGLFTILVRPINPPNDSFGAFISRSSEGATQKYGKVKFINLLVTFISISGIGLVQMLHYFKLLWDYRGIFISDNVYILYLNVIFLIFSNIFYWFVTLSNIQPSQKSESTNLITLYFNTYPLFLRYAFGWALFILSFVLKSNISQSSFVLAQFYIFVVHASLILSLSSYYHSNFGRVSRIIGDIFMVLIISLNIPSYWSYYSLILLFMPIGTASKYYGWTISIFTSLVCGYISFILLGNAYYHSLIYAFLYLAFIIIIKTETKEMSNPVDRLFDILKENDINNLSFPEILKQFSRIMNCEGIYFIQSSKTGYYYLQDREIETGNIPESSNYEIFTYLNANQQNIIFNTNINSLELINKQNRMLTDMGVFKVLRPPSLRGLKSVLVSSIPHKKEQYLIFTNSFTRNGITKRSFSTSHARTAIICGNILSILYKNRT